MLKQQRKANVVHKLKLQAYLAAAIWLNSFCRSPANSARELAWCPCSFENYSVLETTLKIACLGQLAARMLDKGQIARGIISSTRYFNIILLQNPQCFFPVFQIEYCKVLNKKCWKPIYQFYCINKGVIIMPEFNEKRVINLSF